MAEAKRGEKPVEDILKKEREMGEYGECNRMLKKARLRTKLYKKYDLPVAYIKEEFGTGSRGPRFKRVTCVGKYTHHALFVTDKGIPVSLTYYDLAMAFQRRAGGVLQ